MPETRTVAELLDAEPLERIDFFGDLQVQARNVECYAEPNRTDAPTKQIRTVAAAVKEAGALLAETLQVVEALVEELAAERQQRAALESRLRVLESSLLPAGVL